MWGGPENPELLELVRQRLKDGPVSLASWGTGSSWRPLRWRAKDARPAVRELLEMGAVSANPAGRLTKESVIRLR